jgi:CHAD domain-containing protein
LTLPRFKPGDPSGSAVRRALETGLARIQASEAEARRGDGEGVHRLRIATRRLRSELRTYRDLVDRRRHEPVEAELKWLAGLLGEVRDVDILVDRLRKALPVHGGAEADEQALAPLFSELMARRARASLAVRNALQGERYRGLLTALEAAIAHPTLEDAAWVPCREALPPLAAAALRRLKKAAKGLRRDDPDEEFHAVRKRAKHARYTAEAITPALGRAATKNVRRFIRRTTRVQDVLGEHQDAVVACGEVARALAAHAADVAFTQAARRLLDRQLEAAREARSHFFDLWDELDRKKLRRWMKIASKAGR